MGRFFCPNFCSPQNYAIIPVATASVVCASMSLCLCSAASVLLLFSSAASVLLRLYSNDQTRASKHPFRSICAAVVILQR